jgi:hypothetical protein
MAKKKPNYTARQIGAGGVVGGIVSAAGSVMRDTDTSYVPKVTEKMVQDPNSDVPHSILTQVYSMVPPEATPLHDIIHHAGEAGVKGALIGAGAVAAYKGIKKLKNRNLGRQW